MKNPISFLAVTQPKQEVTASGGGKFENLAPPKKNSTDSLPHFFRISAFQKMLLTIGTF